MPKFGSCWICRPHAILPFLFAILFSFSSYLSNSYQLRVEGMLLNEEFKLSVDELKPSIECLQQACKGKIWKAIWILMFPFLLYLNMSWRMLWEFCHNFEFKSKCELDTFPFLCCRYLEQWISSWIFDTHPLDWKLHEFSKWYINVWFTM